MSRATSTSPPPTPTSRRCWPKARSSSASPSAAPHRRSSLAEGRRTQGARSTRIADLLDEVTALVEHPVVYVGEFEAEYLDVPQECLILTMQQNQKYFPLLDGAGKLLNRFLIVSNMQVADPTNIIGGNARVVRPRLSDARFFFEQDKKTASPRLEARRRGLSQQARQLGRPRRAPRALAAQDRRKARRRRQRSPPARALAKADLLTDMVGEFPELQGIMGRYYALHDGEGPEVADAIQAALPAALRRRRAAGRQHRLRRRAGRQARCAGRLLRHRPGADRRQGPLRPAPRRARRAAHPDGNAAAARSAELIDDAASRLRRAC
jgi:hypothetical protein